MKLARLIIGSIGVVALTWATLTALLFEMSVSSAIGLGAFVAIGIAHRFETKRFVAAALVFLAPLVLLEVAVPEFVQVHTETSCRVRAAIGEPRPECTAIEVPKSGASMSSREHLAYRWLNLHIAAGGWLLGYQEAAWETLLLDRLSTTRIREEMQARPMRERRRMCEEGAGNDGEVVVRESDFAMDDHRTQDAVSKLARRTRDGQERWENVRYRLQSPWHVWFALLVPGSMFHAKRSGETLDLWYRGSIQYPPHVITAADLPLPSGNLRFVLDEAPFCGLQMDGVFVPYVVEWRWSMERSAAEASTTGDRPRMVQKLLSLLD